MGETFEGQTGVMMLEDCGQRLRVPLKQQPVYFRCASLGQGELYMRAYELTSHMHLGAPPSTTSSASIERALSSPTSTWAILSCR